MTRLAGNRAAGDVANRHRIAAELLCFAQRRNGVRRLTALADDKERFALLNTPDPSYHGVTYTEAFGPAAFIGRCRVVPLRNTGAALSPFSAFLILQGLETLALRMERHTENALKVARYLQAHEQVAWVK